HPSELEHRLSPSQRLVQSGGAVHRQQLGSRRYVLELDGPAQAAVRDQWSDCDPALDYSQLRGDYDGANDLGRVSDLRLDGRRLCVLLRTLWVRTLCARASRSGLDANGRRGTAGESLCDEPDDLECLGPAVRNIRLSDHGSAIQPHRPGDEPGLPARLLSRKL